MADPTSDGGAPERDAVSELVARHSEYWRRNLRYLSILIVVWFVVSYGFGILFADVLNQVRIPGTGFPLGFWFAQQGSIYVFVVLIFVYVALMNRLDKAFDVDEEAEA